MKVSHSRTLNIGSERADVNFRKTTTLHKPPNYPSKNNKTHCANSGFVVHDGRHKGLAIRVWTVLMTAPKSVYKAGQEGKNKQRRTRWRCAALQAVLLWLWAETQSMILCRSTPLRCQIRKVLTAQR